MCQRPIRAFFISTHIPAERKQHEYKRCQRPKRAFFISTTPLFRLSLMAEYGVNALNGLSSFLRIIPQANDK